MNYKQRGFWLIIAQQGDSIQFFTREMRFTFSVSYLTELEPFWDIPDDDQNNLVYQIMVDTLVKNKLEVYLIYQNATMRKFSATIPYSCDAGCTFEEHPHVYSIE